MGRNDELNPCHPVKISITNFNNNAILPYNFKIEHIYKAMSDFIEFLDFINTQLYSKNISKLESMLMPANFSSVVGEFINSAIPKYCETLAKNQYHNGHPDLIPINMFENNAVQYTHEGIEIKASRYLKGWQGHNPESVWLLVFIFRCSRPNDTYKKIKPIPFEFLAVYSAKLDESDWSFSGRSKDSRRTITASVNQTGYTKMTNNWIYKS